MTNMKSMLLLLGLICAASEPVFAQEYKYRQTKFRSAGWVDTGKGYSTTATGASLGIFYQWIGTHEECGDRGGCKYSVLKTKTVATSWKYGTFAGAKETPYPGNEINLNITSELGQTFTDTDTYTFEKSFGSGWTVAPTTGVYRFPFVRTYYGVWVKDKEDVRCPTNILIKCDRYVWKKDEYGGTGGGKSPTQSKRSSGPLGRPVMGGPPG